MGHINGIFQDDQLPHEIGNLLFISVKKVLKRAESDEITGLNSQLSGIGFSIVHGQLKAFRQVELTPGRHIK